MVALFDPLPGLTSGDTAMFLDQQGFGLEPPGYIWFLTAVGDPRVVVLLQMALTVVVAIFTFVRTRLLWLAFAIAACPFLIVFELRLLTEAVVCNLVWLVLLLLCWPAHRRRLTEPIMAGVLLGLASLTRDTLWLMPLLLALLAFRTNFFKPAVVACLAAFLTVLPWQAVHGGKISEGRAGFALWIGTWERNPDWQLGGMENWPAEANGTAELRTALARHDDEPFAKAAIGAMIAHPAKVAGTWIVRYPRLWIGTRTDNLPMRLTGIAWFAAKLAFFLLNVAVVALALAGAWTLRNDPKARLLAVPAIYLGIVLIPFHNTETRYSLPAMIPLLWFAGHAIRPWPVAARRRARRATFWVRTLVKSVRS